VTKLILFDVGETLIHDGQPFPYVIDALKVIADFTTDSGTSVLLGVVSDFNMPSPTVTESKIAALEHDFLKILVTAHLDVYFQPFAERVTLSTRAGVFKPARSIFELAAQRSGIDPTFAECLFVTEKETHLDACKTYGMKTVKFGADSPNHPTFSDWRDGPTVIAHTAVPDSTSSGDAALAFALSTRHNIAGFIPLNRSDDKLHGQADRLVQLDRPELGDLRGIYVNIPTDVAVTQSNDGKLSDVMQMSPLPEDIVDAAATVKSLQHHGKIDSPEHPQAGATHQIENDEQGRRVLVRRRYSMVSPSRSASSSTTGEPKSH
jgi:hypothetical protein